MKTTDNKSTIFIKDAEESDGGEYICKVLDEEVKHLVNINVMPGIVAIPSTGVVTVEEGENATLAFEITQGGPGTFLSWETESVR